MEGGAGPAASQKAQKPAGDGFSKSTATLSDVARLAGVSIATASKALNGRSQVRATTRARVVAAAEQLSFSPNRLATSLLSGRSGTVGLVTHDLEGRFSIPMLMGAEDAFGAGQISVLLCDARGDSIREQYHIRALLGRRVDGLIIVGARPDPRSSLGPLPVPVVYAYAPSDGAQDMSLISDNIGGGRLAVEHLTACGRSRIAIITGDPSYGAATDRVTGATAALAEAGLELVGGRALYGAWTEEWGRGATRSLIAQHPEIDALLCGSDQIARGALDVLHDMGCRVPHDIAVTGHDNWGALAEHARPPLTSIDMNLEELGKRAAARLFGAIEGHTAHGVEIVPCRLVLRASTAS